MLTPKEAGAKLFVGAATVRNYITQGVGKENIKLKALRVRRGRRWEYRIGLQDLEDFKNKWLV